MAHLLAMLSAFLLGKRLLFRPIGILLNFVERILSVVILPVARLLTRLYLFLVTIYSKIKKYVDKFMPIDDSNSTVRMIKQGKSATYMITMVCLLPAVPNGFIPYAAVNAGLKLSKYTFAVTIGCALPTLVMTALGGTIAEAKWMLMAFLIGISFVGVFMLLRYQHHILKMLEMAKHKSTMLITTEIPEHEIDDEMLEKGNGIAPRRYKLSKRVMYPSALKYQDIPDSDVANPFSAFFSFKQTPAHPENSELEELERENSEKEKAEKKEKKKNLKKDSNDGRDDMVV